MQWESSELPEGPYQSAMDTLRSTLAEYLAFISLDNRGRPTHVSSQEKEAIFATHDIYIPLLPLLLHRS